jgi:hypothetical protein
MYYTTVNRTVGLSGCRRDLLTNPPPSKEYKQHTALGKTETLQKPTVEKRHRPVNIINTSAIDGHQLNVLWGFAPVFFCQFQRQGAEKK